MKKIIIISFFIIFLLGCGSTDRRERAFNKLKDECPGPVSLSYTIGSWSDELTVTCVKVKK